MQAGQVFIGGTWHPPVSGETYATIHPATAPAELRYPESVRRTVPRSQGAHLGRDLVSGRDDRQT